MNQYIISKNQKLSDIMTEIEPNINLAKKFPGIGATYLEICLLYTSDAADEL